MLLLLKLYCVVECGFYYYVLLTILLSRFVLLSTRSTARIEGQYLRFNGITPADAGRYYCSASNRYGNTTKMAEVTVNRRGPYLPSPRAQTYNIREGDDVTLDCDVQSVRETLRGEIRVSASVILFAFFTNRLKNFTN